MKPPDKKLNWRIGYAVCCLIYVVCMVYLSLNNFDMVHGDFKRGGAQLQPAQIKKIALKELAEQCRKELKRSGRLQTSEDKASVGTEDVCRSWPPEVLEARQKAVEERLGEEQRVGGRKLLVFYLFFTVFVLILPPFILYKLLSVIFWMFRNIRVEK